MAEEKIARFGTRDLERGMRHAREVIAALGLLLASGCAGLIPRATTAPMPTVVPQETDIDSSCLVVFLPGRGDRAEHFLERGFVEALRTSDSSLARCRVVAADAHLGYYAEGSIITRLRTDIVAPALAAGTRDVWLVGISLGGLGASLYTKKFEDEIAGIVMLAPYLGEKEILDEIRAAGGPRAWTHPPEFEERDLRAVWAWFQRRGVDGAAPRPTIYLGWGEGDRFAPTCRLAAELLPPDHAFTAKGGHVWATWRRLWIDFLKRYDPPA